MTLYELIRRASKGYEKDFPESPLTEQCHEDGKPLSWQDYQARGVGDTLGRFVVIELFETFDPEADDSDQLDEAIRVMRMARGNLDNILVELENGEDVSIEITDEMDEAVTESLGQEQDHSAILNAIEEHKGLHLTEMRKTLKRKLTALNNQGGRGVDLADEIDSLRIAIAVRKYLPKK